jgi:hypothetical protein
VYIFCTVSLKLEIPPVFAKMSVFYHEEPPNHSKKCKFLAATLKDVFSNCSACGGQISTPGPEEEYPTTDVDDDQEVLTFS